MCPDFVPIENLTRFSRFRKILEFFSFFITCLTHFLNFCFNFEKFRPISLTKIFSLAFFNNCGIYSVVHNIIKEELSPDKSKEWLELTVDKRCVG